MFQDSPFDLVRVKLMSVENVKFGTKLELHHTAYLANVSLGPKLLSVSVNGVLKVFFTFHLKVCLKWDITISVNLTQTPMGFLSEETRIMPVFKKVQAS